MLILDSFDTITDEPSASPFCTKAMCMLEMAGVEWKIRYLPDPTKSPKKKFPVLHDGDKAIADSEFIRMHLEDHHGVNFDDGLSNEQKAISRAIIRMMDEHFYFIILSNRWVDEANWQEVKTGFFGQMPFPLRQIVPGIVRKSIIKALDGHGLGRHNFDEQLIRGKQDVDAVAAILGNQSFLFGDEPTAADVSVAVMLRSANRLNPLRPISDHVMSNSKLMAYIDRCKVTFYPKELTRV